MVATSNPIASAVGNDILRRGGNAFDAAVAVAALLNVVEPQSSGLGGEGFGMFHFGDTGEIKALNWSTFSPMTEELAERREDVLVAFSPEAQLPPGSLAGFVELRDQHGTMSLEELLQPAIRYAEEGFVVDELMHGSIAGRANRFAEDPVTAATFLVEGEAPPVGTVLKQPDLARTLRLIAAEGKDVLYEGEVGEDIVNHFQSQGAFIDWDDLERASEPMWVEPISTTYRGYTISGMPPVAAGPMLLETLNIVEGFDLSSLSEVERIHVWAEALKLVLVDRDTFVGDPDFIDVPLDDLISKEWGDERRARISMDEVMEWPFTLPRGGGGTTHWVVADADGNVASVTNTVNSWGNSRLVGSTGLFFNDGIRFGSLDPEHPNFLEPGKRLRKNMGPALVHDEDGNLVLAIGAAGGSRIWQAIAQAISYRVDLGMNLQEAVDAPRVSYGSPGARLTVSRDISEETFQALADMGHDVGRGVSANVQAVEVDPATGDFLGAADFRRSGRAIGNPHAKDDCKAAWYPLANPIARPLRVLVDGWEHLGFGNQGQCVRYAQTGTHN